MINVQKIHLEECKDYIKHNVSEITPRSATIEGGNQSNQNNNKHHNRVGENKMDKFENKTSGLR